MGTLQGGGDLGPGQPGRTARLGCLDQQLQRVGEGRSSKASSAAGKPTQAGAERNTYRVRSQINVWWIRVENLHRADQLAVPATGAQLVGMGADQVGEGERFACRVTRSTGPPNATSLSRRGGRPGRRAAAVAGYATMPKLIPGGRTGGLPRRPWRGLVRNHNKVQRLWRDEGLRFPQHRWRKRVGFLNRAPHGDRGCGIRVGSVDFQSQSTTDGRPVKIVLITPANAWAVWSTTRSPPIG
jgi:hypothetical protein